MCFSVSVTQRYIFRLRKYFENCLHKNFHFNTFLKYPGKKINRRCTYIAPSQKIHNFSLYYNLSNVFTIRIQFFMSSLNSLAYWDTLLRIKKGNLLNHSTNKTLHTYLLGKKIILKKGGGDFQEIYTHAQYLEPCTQHLDPRTQNLDPSSLNPRTQNQEPRTKNQEPRN